MKKLWLVSAGMAFIFVSVFILHAQETAGSSSDLAAELQAIEAMPTISASQLAASGLEGTFYSAQHAPGTEGEWPPLPGDWLSLPVWEIDTNLFLIDDLDYRYGTAQSAATASGLHAMDAGGDDFSPDLSFDTNSLYLQITGVTNEVADLDLFNGTDTVYAIWGSTNLATPLTQWQVETELWPTNDTTNTLPFTVNGGDNANLFLQAQDWTGMETNGLPAWWVFYWFGNLSETAATLDASGNTLLADYEAQTDPNVISFWIQTTNNYVNTMNAPVRLVISGGEPADIAVSVDDTNYAADANWQTYTETNINVNLGLNEGWHNVWIGLKGVATNATVTWEPARLKLDLTPPTLAITNPTTNMVAVPLIQLQGYANESLGSLTFDVSNATGIFTNQAGQLLAGQFFDTNLWDYTTDYFQCYDIPLTNDLNVITVRAVDLAGNVTVTNFNYTLDYSIATNPVIQLTWPYDGAEICGGSFTVRGRVDDATAGVLAMITDTNGDTNIVNGVVERNGNLWAENLPLHSGTNEVTLWVTNAAGLGSETNFSVVQNTMTLTLDNISGDLWLPTVNVSGHISDPSAPMWVNGVQGTNNGDGTWNASNVPVSAGGVASFDVSTDPTNAPDPITTTNQDKPTEVTVDSWHTTASAPDYGELDYTLNYSASSGGTIHSVDLGELAGEIVTTDIKYAPDFSMISEQDNYQFANSVDDYTTETTGGLPLYPDYGQGSLSGNPANTVYNENEVMALHVGGKSYAGQKVLAQVETSVAGLAPTLVDGPHYGTYAIPPEQVDIPKFGENLDAGGAAYAAVAVGSSVDVTPTTTGAPYYDWSKSDGEGGEDSTAYTPKIIANGSDLSVTNPEFCVGQQVNFGLYWSPDTPPIVNMVGNWNLPEKFVNEVYQPFVLFSPASTVYDINNGLLANTNQISCWFVNGSGGKVVVGMNLLFTNGQNASIAADGSFTVYRPTFSDFHNDGNGFTWSTPSLIGSMAWDVTLNSKYDGLFGITQLINSDNENSVYYNGGYDYLDGNTEIYGTPQTNGPSEYTASDPRTHDILFGDSPIAIAAPCVYMQANFKDYLRFQPAGNNSIYVTIATNGWYMNGDACLAGGISPDDLPPASASVDNDTFPTWTGVRHGGGD